MDTRDIKIFILVCVFLISDSFQEHGGVCRFWVNCPEIPPEEETSGLLKGPSQKTLGGDVCARVYIMISTAEEVGGGGSSQNLFEAAACRLCARMDVRPPPGQEESKKHS